jgi:hypothetical protein
VAHLEFCKYLLIIDASNSGPVSLEEAEGEGTGSGFCFYSCFSKLALTYCSSASVLRAFSVIYAS